MAYLAIIHRCPARHSASLDRPPFKGPYIPVFARNLLVTATHDNLTLSKV